MATYILSYKYFKYTQIYLKDIFYIFLGLLITVPFLLFLTVVTLPFILCRQSLALLLSKKFRRDHGYRKMVSPGFSTAYALEYISSVCKGEPSRNSAFSRTVIEGHVPLEFLKDKIETGWINSRNVKNLRKFPMFREYVHSWMGYCYWRKDFNFDLNTHLHCHKIKEYQDMDQCTSELIEELMNTPFKQKRSPWDVYVIHGWRQISTGQEDNSSVNTEVTVVVSRSHHIFGDGKSFASLLIKDLFGNRLEDCQKKPLSNLLISSANTSQNSRTAAFSFVLTVLKLMRDFGCIAYIMLWKAKANTKLHKFDNPGFVHQMSPLISMDSVKIVRKKFEVNFSSVVVSGLAAAIADSLNNENVSKFLLAAPRPLPGHPEDKMVNHLTGAVYNVPSGVNIHPIQRLQECDKVLKMVNQSLFPIYVFPVVLHLLSFHIAPIAKFGFKSRLFGASFSNNVGAEVPMHAFGKHRILEITAAVGTFDGSTGVVVLMGSYVNHFRLHAIANSAALNKTELKLFMERVISEIESLTKLTLASNKDTYVT